MPAKLRAARAAGSTFPPPADSVHFPSPLWGGVRGGGRCVGQRRCITASPPSPTLPHKGGREQTERGERERTEFAALISALHPLVPAKAGTQIGNLDSQHKRVYARLRRAMRGNERKRCVDSNGICSNITHTPSPPTPSHPHPCPFPCQACWWCRWSRRWRRPCARAASPT